MNNGSGNYQWYPFDSYITQSKRQSYQDSPFWGGELGVSSSRDQLTWPTNLIDRCSGDHLQSYEFKGVVGGWTMWRNNARTDVWRQLRAGLCCDIPMLCILYLQLVTVQWLDIKGTFCKSLAVRAVAPSYIGSASGRSSADEIKTILIYVSYVYVCFIVQWAHTQDFSRTLKYWIENTSIFGRVNVLEELSTAGLNVK